MCSEEQTTFVSEIGEVRWYEGYRHVFGLIAVSKLAVCEASVVGDLYTHSFSHHSNFVKDCHTHYKADKKGSFKK